MPCVTALKCSLTGVIGAFVAQEQALTATVAPLTYYEAAGAKEV